MICECVISAHKHSANVQQLTSQTLHAFAVCNTHQQQFWVKREKVELDYGITTTTDNQPEQFDDPRIQVEVAYSELTLFG
jgi:hypothetical protein